MYGEKPLDAKQAEALYDLIVEEFCSWMKLAYRCYTEDMLKDPATYKKFAEATVRKLEHIFYVDDSSIWDIVDETWTPLMKAFLFSEKIRFIKK